MTSISKNSSNPEERDSLIQKTSESSSHNNNNNNNDSNSSSSSVEKNKSIEIANNKTAPPITFASPTTGTATATATTPTTTSGNDSNVPQSFASYNLEVAGLLFANVASVVGIVAVNKRIYQSGFNLPSALMTLHFVVTYTFVYCFQKFGYFKEKKIETKHYVKLGAAQVGSVALLNLSLVVNPVGIYQLMKFLVLFVTCGLEYIFYKKVYSTQVYIILALLVLSVSFATIQSLQFNLIGFLFGLGGAIATSYYQILNKHIQQEYEVSALQLLHYEQPWSAMWCAMLSLSTEPVQKVAEIDWNPQLFWLIGLSACCAFVVNVTVYLIIGKTSPITFSVMGHLKTVSIFALGYFVLGDSVSSWQGFWMMCAFALILFYGKVTSGGPATPPPTAKQEEASSAFDEKKISKEPTSKVSVQELRGEIDLSDDREELVAAVPGRN